ncbi:nicotinate (nicotinamide) nucleotide adenylyltransferase [Membranihabitans marinus]|uniref:nicotinate (nicotinamide) nucleotide adenylyltransferase n=1 Tax=Membranihabitans marinus TaxID=1227546 RepID=UPI001F237768|nr:nicotinate (nicotinamide) nucleotide adenylyltransferase [Membranihabitans marinus]
MKVGLFFGSFNPVHVGHMIIANHMVEYTDLDQVWMVVSPQNPFKKSSNLANDYDRLQMVELATNGNDRLRASNIEFALPKPSYTIDTLVYLKEKYPNNDFSLIMGGDNLVHFHKWKNYEAILEHYRILVYKRPNYVTEAYDNHPSIQIVDAPLMQISATFIRQALRDGKSIQYLVPDPVWKFLDLSPIYR